MSIAPTDVLPAEPGFAPDATEAIPQVPFEALPETDDGLATVTDGPLPPEAPGEAEPESDTSTETEPDYQSHIETLTAQHKKQIDDLQSIRRREVEEARQQGQFELMAKMAREPVLMRGFHNILTRFGIDPQQAAEQLELELARVDRAESNMRQQQNAEVASADQMVQADSQRFHEWNEYARQQGKPVIDGNDPEFLVIWGRAQQIRRQYGPAALRAQYNEQQGLPVSAQDSRAARMVYDAGVQLRLDQEAYREKLAQRAEAQKNANVARGQKAAATRQQNRGAQHIAHSGGAGPMTDAQIIAEAFKRFPDDEAARIKFVSDTPSAPAARR